MEIGKTQKLMVNRFTSVGAFLEDENEESVLLPKKWIPQGLAEGDSLEVFVYLDNEERPIATTMKPLLERGQFGMLKVKDVGRHWAFLEWGLEKDLFVPFIEQHPRMEEGRSYPVYMYLDEMSGRLTATARLEAYVEKEEIDLKKDQAVELLIVRKTELGYLAIVDQRYMGLIYENEVFQPIKAGDKLSGYVKKIREDRKLDISLEKQGYGSIEPNAEKILTQLKQSGGRLALNDKSDPADIYKQLQISKKIFKKAIGALYKNRLIDITEDGIILKK